MKIFISAPISSISNQQKKHNLRTEIDHTIKKIKKAFPQSYLYFSPHNLSTSGTETVLRDIENVCSCDIFILIYPESVATSSLFETGIAYAEKKRLIFCKKENIKLPFMLQNLLNSTIIEYSDMSELEKTLLKELSQYANHGW